jgi:hypothetical protein
MIDLLAMLAALGLIGAVFGVTALLLWLGNVALRRIR